MSSYDQNLLEEAPKATRAQLQEGYNVDLLEQPQPPRRAPSVRNPPPPQTVAPPPQPVAVTLTDAGSGEKLGAAVPRTLEAPRPRTPFWRSPKGIFAIIVIAVVVVGAVVGGAVGGTAKKGSNNLGSTGLTGATSAASSSTTTAPPNTNQGFGGVNTHGATPTP